MSSLMSGLLYSIKKPSVLVTTHTLFTHSWELLTVRFEWYLNRGWFTLLKHAKCSIEPFSLHYFAYCVSAVSDINCFVNAKSFSSLETSSFQRCFGVCSSAGLCKSDKYWHKSGTWSKKDAIEILKQIHFRLKWEQAASLLLPIKLLIWNDVINVINSDRWMCLH